MVPTNQMAAFHFKNHLPANQCSALQLKIVTFTKLIILLYALVHIADAMTCDQKLNNLSSLNLNAMGSLAFIL